MNLIRKEWRKLKRWGSMQDAEGNGIMKLPV